MNSQFELLHPDRRPKGRIRAVIFDFDGTFSTLRCGWETVMSPMMAEFFGGTGNPAIQKMVDEYIDASTGIQTIYQMRWLAEQLEAAGKNVRGRDEWWYKAEYNRRLMRSVGERLTRLESGGAAPENYLIEGAVAFLKALRANGIDVYLASGTDHEDVLREAKALGVDGYFTAIQGAPEHEAACSKEAVLRRLLTGRNLSGDSLLVVGDGKVEIALGSGNGAYTLGAATDETLRRGINPVKRKRLIAASADAITGDFTCLPDLCGWLGIDLP